MQRITTATVSVLLAAALALAAHAEDAKAPADASSALGKDPGVPGSVANHLAGILTRTYTPKQVSEGVYVGSAFCLACHPRLAGWRDTLHASFLRRPMARHSLVPRRGVIADYDGNGVDDFIQGLDFNEISSPFDVYTPNAPVLSVEDGTYYVTIGELKCAVTFTQAGQGGGSGQRYVVRIPVSDTPTGFTESNYFAPLQYVPGAGWLPNSPQNWYDENNFPRFEAGIATADLADHSGNYSATCIGCHATGIRDIGPNDFGEVAFNGVLAVLFESADPGVFDYDGDGIFEQMNIGCEACHGPGSAHVTSGGRRRFIVNPAKLPVSAQVDICGRCHSRPRSVPNGTYNWPFNDETKANWTPVDAKDGVPLTDFMVDASVRWPDGKHGRITRPYHDFLESGKSTSPFGAVSCTGCHDPHAEDQPHQIRTDVIEEGVRILTAVDDNTLCLACHAGVGAFDELDKEDVAGIRVEERRDKVAKVVSRHSNHPYAPERGLGLSRCVGCHMTPMSGFGSLTVPTHTFEPVGPAKTLDFQDEGGMPNACAQSCHGNLVNTFGLGLDPNPNNAVWNEPFDRDLAAELLFYFGPGGLWWDTEEEGEP